MLKLRWKRVALTVLAIFMGATLVAALLSVTSEIADKIGVELRQYGANMVLVPEKIYLDESRLPKIKSIFWRHNIVGIAPILSTPVTINGKEKTELTGTWFNKKIKIPDGTFFGRRRISGGTVNIGIKDVSPWWKVQGRWITNSSDTENALVGEAVAKRLRLKVGDNFGVERNGTAKALRVSGILSAGGLEDDQIFVNIQVTQQLMNLPGKASKAKISAMIVPKAKLPKSIRNKKLSEMTPKEYETWYCTPTVEAISKQITEVVPDVEVKPIRQITEAESNTFSKIESMISLAIGVGLLISGLAVTSTMTTAVLERRSEIGLNKAIGATDQQIAWQFMVEAALMGLTGGLFGIGAGFGLAQFIGRSVFGTGVSFDLFVFATTLIASLGVALVGSLIPIRSAMKVKPAITLRGE